MARYDLGKWDLKELVKKPTRAEIDKKLAKLESSTKRFEKIKKSLNSNISSTKFRKILRDIEIISEKSSIIHGYASLR